MPTQFGKITTFHLLWNQCFLQSYIIDNYCFIGSKTLFHILLDPNIQNLSLHTFFSLSDC